MVDGVCPDKTCIACNKESCWEHNLAQSIRVVGCPSLSLIGRCVYALLTICRIRSGNYSRCKPTVRNAHPERIIPGGSCKGLEALSTRFYAMKSESKVWYTRLGKSSSLFLPFLRRRVSLYRSTQGASLDTVWHRSCFD